MLFMPDSVHTRIHGPITVVTLDRANVRNAVDADTARQLHDAFAAFDADPESRVAVFHGAHGHFCAGWDLQAIVPAAVQARHRRHQWRGGGGWHGAGVMV
jgi:enoyl-CoA hydratase